MGNFQNATIKITPDSYRWVYRPSKILEPDTVPVPHKGLSKIKYDIFGYRPFGNQTYGSFDLPESRCGKMIESDGDGHTQPFHPLLALLKKGNTDDSSSEMYNRLRHIDRFNYNDMFCQVFPGLEASKYSNCLADINSFKLALNSETTDIFPRDLIWLDSAGGTDANGFPNARYDHAYLNLAITRAMDLLNTAPAREDALPVRKKVVLVFSDGYESTPQETRGENNPLSVVSDYNFNRSDSPVVGSSYLPDESGESYMLTNSAANICGENAFSSDLTSPTKGKNPLFLHTSQKKEQIDNFTSMKLGFLIYNGNENHHFVSSRDDAFSILYGSSPQGGSTALPGHNYNELLNLKFNAVNSSCNSYWSALRGSFLMTTINGNKMIKRDNFQEHARRYTTRMIPGTLRALFINETFTSNHKVTKGD